MTFVIAYFIVGLVIGLGLVIDAYPHLDTDKHRILKLTAISIIAVVFWVLFISYDYHKEYSN